MTIFYGEMENLIIETYTNDEVIEEVIIEDEPVQFAEAEYTYEYTLK